MKQDLTSGKNDGFLTSNQYSEPGVGRERTETARACRGVVILATAAIDLSNIRHYEMTNTDLTLHRERLLALRARLLGDMTQMEDDSLKDHGKTTSIPTDMEELGSDNADQELTLTLLGSDEDILDQIEAAIERIEDGSYGRCEECGGKSPSPAWTPSLMRQTMRPMCFAREEGHEASRRH